LKHLGRHEFSGKKKAKFHVASEPNSGVVQTLDKAFVEQSLGNRKRLARQLLRWTAGGDGLQFKFLHRFLSKSSLHREFFGLSQVKALMARQLWVVCCKVVNKPKMHLHIDCHQSCGHQLEWLFHLIECLFKTLVDWLRSEPKSGKFNRKARVQKMLEELSNLQSQLPACRKSD
jgi:hypothetical protein